MVKLQTIRDNYFIRDVLLQLEAKMDTCIVSLYNEIFVLEETFCTSNKDDISYLCNVISEKYSREGDWDVSWEFGFSGYDKGVRFLIKETS